MEKFINSLKPYTKSIIAGLVGLLQVVQVYVMLSSNGMTLEDVNTFIGAMILAIGGTGAVYQFPNKKS